MQMIRTDLLEPGMILGQAIHNDGRVLLNQGVELTDAYIRAIRRLEMSSVKIDDADTRDIDVETSISQETHSKGTRATRETFDKVDQQFQKASNKVPGDVEEILESPEFAKRMNSGKIFSAISDFANVLMRELADKPASVALQSIKSYDALLFQHAVDVAVVALSIARELQLPERHQDDIVLGAMLHDIGLTVVSREMLRKPRSEYSQYERRLYRAHPLFGRKILASNMQMGQKTRAIMVVSQHHERHRGGGFPYRLQGKDEPWQPNRERHQNDGIFHLAAIVNIANVFDMLTSPGIPGVRPASNADAAFIMTNRMYGFFHPHYLDTFLRILQVFPVGSNIQLTDEGPYYGHVGTVVRTEGNPRFSPVVRLFFDAKQRRLPQPIEVDLAAEGISLYAKDHPDLPEHIRST